jgi:hypothetical protein
VVRDINYGGMSVAIETACMPKMLKKPAFRGSPQFAILPRSG